MAAKGISHRKWALHRSDYQTDADFRAAVEQEMALNVQIMERLGVAIVSGPARQRVGDNWVTHAMVFETATIPAGRETPPPGEVEELEAALDDAEPVEAD